MEPSAPPVVLNSSLGGSDIAKYFSGLNYKVRISDNTEKNSIIFPKSSLAVVLFSVEDLAEKCSSVGDNYADLAKPAIGLVDKQILKILDRFAAVNRKCYLVLMATRFGQRELAIFSAIQQYFASSNLNLLFTHSAKECVQCVTSIADGIHKDASVQAKEYMERIMQRQSQCDKYVYNSLMYAGVKYEDVLSVHQGCSSLASVVTATKDQLQDNTNLDGRTAQDVVEFFERNLYAD